MTTRKTIATTALLGLVAAAFLMPQPARAELSRQDVEKIVEEFIMKNPEKILTAVDEYQRKSMQERQTSALAENKDMLFNDKDAPFAGNPDGDVTIVVFFDYNCGYCKKAFPEMDAILKEDKNVKLILKDLPILGPTSETAARWALAAHRQGKYYAYHAQLMQHQGPIDDAVLETLAKAAGVETIRQKIDMKKPGIMVEIEKNRLLANTMGINGTPGFVIGDEIIPGMVPKAMIMEKIEAIRAKAKKTP
jgi:protein-disulfide isomerase